MFFINGQFSLAQLWALSPDTALPLPRPCSTGTAAGVFFPPSLLVFQQRPWCRLSPACWADSFWVPPPIPPGGVGQRGQERGSASPDDAGIRGGFLYAERPFLLDAPQ